MIVNISVCMLVFIVITYFIVLNQQERSLVRGVIASKVMHKKTHIHQDTFLK